jgi:6-phosphogluconolactonase
MNIREYPDREFLFLQLADLIAGQLADFLRREGRASFSVPGGTTPGPVFDTLSGVDIAWAEVSVVPNDERWVPEDSPRSNSRLLRERLLVGRAAAARLVPLYRAAAAPEAVLEALAEGVRPLLPLSVLLLGMGEDMHTASLFPGAAGLDAALAAEAPPLAVLRAAAAGEPRVTLTAPVLRGAIHTHVLITGADKRRAVERAAQLPAAEAPVRLVLDRATVHWAA